VLGGAATGALGGAAVGVLGGAAVGALEAAAGGVFGRAVAGVLGCVSVFAGSAGSVSGAAVTGAGVAAGAAGSAALIGGFRSKGPGGFAGLPLLPGTRTVRMGKGCGDSAAAGAVCDFSFPSSARMRCSMHCKF